MDLSRIKQAEADVTVLAVGICRTPHGSTHTGVVHRDLDDHVRFFEQAFHKDTRNEPVQESVAYCNGRFLFTVPDIDPDRAENIAALCRLIAVTGPALAYALKHDPDARFDEHTGQLALPNGKGLNCSTFVLVVFKSARHPLIDFNGWPEREQDIPAHEDLICALRKTPPSEQEHIDAVENEVGCVRARPEEVAGSCLGDLPARFEVAAPAGIAIVERLDGLSEAVSDRPA